MEKKEFEKCIKAIQKESEYLDELSKLNINIFENLHCQTFLIHTLELLFNDTEDNWIQYYIYELRFGKEYVPGTVTFEGKDIPLKTVEDLYNLLTEKL